MTIYVGDIYLDLPMLENDLYLYTQIISLNGPYDTVLLDYITTHYSEEYRPYRLSSNNLSLVTDIFREDISQMIEPQEEPPYGF